MVSAKVPSLEIHVEDEESTLLLARSIAALLKTGDIVALQGPLGAGKSVLARNIIRALGWHKDEVPSPTFTLVQQYELSSVMVWHFDLYRLENAEDAFELGIEDAFADGVSLIEWPDRLGGYLPREHLRVELAFGERSSQRTVNLVGSGGWPDRLEPLVNART